MRLEGISKRYRHTGPWVVRGTMSQATNGLRLPLQPAAVSALLVIATWTLSTTVAARRTGS